MTYTVKSVTDTEGVTATKATKAIKLSGATAGATVKVTVTVSAEKGTSQDVVLTLTTAE